MSKKLIIFGNSDQAKCVYNVFQIEGIDVHGFCVDDTYWQDSTFVSKPIYKSSWFVENLCPGEYMLFLPLGQRGGCKFRKIKYEYFKQLGYEFYTFISRASLCYTNRENIGKNVYIGMGTGIHPDVMIHDNCYLSDYSSIGHDSIILEHSFIGPSVTICGNCRIGESVSIGAGTIVRENVSIIDGATLGMGISIHRDITKPKTYFISPLDKKYYDRRNR